MLPTACGSILGWRLSGLLHTCYPLGYPLYPRYPLGYPLPTAPTTQCAAKTRCVLLPPCTNTSHAAQSSCPTLPSSHIVDKIHHTNSYITPTQPNPYHFRSKYTSLMVSVDNVGDDRILILSWERSTISRNWQPLPLSHSPPGSNSSRRTY